MVLRKGKLCGDSGTIHGTFGFSLGGARKVFLKKNIWIPTGGGL